MLDLGDGVLPTQPPELADDPCPTRRSCQLSTRPVPVSVVTYQLVAQPPIPSEDVTMSEFELEANQRQFVEELTTGSCPACTRRTSFDLKYRTWFALERYQYQELQTALTDSLSFCPEHADYLCRDSGGRSALVYVHELLARRMLDTLDERDLERFQPETRAPCPACESRAKTADRAVYFLRRGLEGSGSEPYGDPGVCCFPHFRTLTHDTTPNLVPDLLRSQLAALRAAEHALDETEAIPNDESDDAVARALNVSVGHEPVIFILPRSSSEPTGMSSRDPVEEFTQMLGDGRCCPICLEVGRAWREWVAWLDDHAGSDKDISDLLPSCREHAWGCVRQGGPDLAYAVARSALAPPLERVSKALDSLDDSAEGATDASDYWDQSTHLETDGAGDARDRFAERINGRIRTVSRRLPFGGDRRIERALDVLDLPIGCPVCARLETAQRLAIDLLLALLEQPRYRDAFADGYGLCFHHFGDALAHTPRLDVQEILVDVEHAKLQRLRWELREAQRKSSWDARPEEKGIEQTAGWRAARWFAGAYEPTRKSLGE